MLNQVQLIGRLVKNPVVATASNDKKYATFEVAVEEKWTTKGGERDSRTIYPKIVVWGDGTVNAIEKYLVKGSLVFIQGALDLSKKTEGDVTKYYTSIRVSNAAGGEVKFLDRRGQAEEREPGSEG